jgi:hypothetical protein
MSTILKTLKKLEQDKNDLQKNLDLKEMVLQGDSPVYLQSNGVDKKIWLFTGLTACGILMGITLAFFYMKEPNVPQKLESASIQPIAPKTQTQIAQPVKKPSSQLGFSLSAIPETQKSTNTKIYPPAKIPAKKIIAEESTSIQIEPKLKSQPRPPIEQASAPRPAQRPQPAIQQTTKPVAHGTIEGVKIKGIIFFKDQSPSNHIFISTPTEKNKKLKQGETVAGAILEDITPNKVVFSKESRLFTMGLGE